MRPRSCAPRACAKPPFLRRKLAKRAAEADARATQVVSKAIAEGDIQAIQFFLGQKYVDGAWPDRRRREFQAGADAARSWRRDRRRGGDRRIAQDRRQSRRNREITGLSAPATGTCPGPGKRGSRESCRYCSIRPGSGSFAGALIAGLENSGAGGVFLLWIGLRRARRGARPHGCARAVFRLGGGGGGGGADVAVRQWRCSPRSASASRSSAGAGLRVRRCSTRTCRP